MLKNIVIFRIGSAWTAPSIETIEAELANNRFAEIGPTEQETSGWVEPRGDDHGPLLEQAGTSFILKLAVERKSVPASVIKAVLDKRCKQIEASTGRKPGKAVKVEMKVEILLDMLPRAFSKKSACMVWIDPVNRFLVIGTASQNASDRVATQVGDIFAAIGHVMPLSPLVTEMTPAAAMSMWLTTHDAPSGFTVDRECELKQPDDEQSVVRYARHNLELDEIVRHIAEGKRPTNLALTWGNRISFVLTESMTIRKIKFLDVGTDTDDKGFDADAAIETGELAKMIPDLLDALGGEQVATAVEVAVALEVTEGV